MAIPFFQNSLLGDACYSTILFGSLALAESRIPALRTVEKSAVLEIEPAA
jgi:hypothetical protein